MFTQVYDDPNNPTLTAFLAALVTELNSLGNDNFKTGAAIDLAKIENGALIEAHGDRHAAGGNDPLDVASINGAMIQVAAINASHIGLGAIQAQHIGSFGDLIYIDDAILSAQHGDEIEAVEDYTKTIVVFHGCSLPKSGQDNQYVRINTRLVGSSPTWTVECQAELDTGDMVDGTFYYRRIAFR